MDQTRTEDGVRVAIVGSGPSGFFAADALFRASAHVQVDMFERLPVPFGLVRHGVAPDQDKIKSVTRAFERIAEQGQFGFYGNVVIGEDLRIEELQALYDAVILAVGALSPIPLGVPGESLRGCHTSTEFVGWYNGHPHFAGAGFDLSHERALVIGNGNVALDVARVLLKGAAGLGHTDLPAYAMRALAASAIREVQVVGRRGPLQNRFTVNELKEVMKIPGCQVVLPAADRVLSAADAAELAGPGGGLLARNWEQLQKCDETPDPEAPKRLLLRFCVSPLRLEGAGRVERVVLGRNRLEGPPGEQRPVSTGDEESVPAGLVVTCLGYRGEPLPGVPFDAALGIIPNADGRVTTLTGEPVPGLYVVGWIKHRARGVIGDTKADSAATVRTLLADLGGADRRHRDQTAVSHLLETRGVREVQFHDWARLDVEEIERGREAGKRREKFTHIPDMLNFLRSLP